MSEAEVLLKEALTDSVVAYVEHDCVNLIKLTLGNGREVLVWAEADSFGIPYFVVE